MNCLRGPQKLSVPSALKHILILFLVCHPFGLWSFTIPFPKRFPKPIQHLLSVPKVTGMSTGSRCFCWWQLKLLCRYFVMYSVLFWLEQNSVLCSWVSNKLFKGTHVSLHVCRCTPKGVSYGLFFSNLKEKLKTVQEQSENSLHKHCSGIRFLKEATIYVPFFFFFMVSYHMWKLFSKPETHGEPIQKHSNK